MGKRTHRPHPAKHEDTDHNVKVERGGNQGVALVRALFDHDGEATDPARVAEVMAQRPGDADEITDFVQRHAGNRFMHRVTAALPAMRAGEDHNVIISKFVKAKDGYNRHRDTGEGKDRLDRNRLADRNHLPRIGAEPAMVYSSVGAALGACVAGAPVEINAGVFSTIPIDGKPERCMFVYKADPADHGPDPLFGWVPLRAFVQDKVLFHVAAKDERLDRRLEAAQAEGVEFSSEAQLVTPRALPDGVGDLRTVPTHAAKENFARHYAKRPDGTCNLVMDVPGSGRGRIGAASDRVSAGTRFHRATSIAPAHTPLFVTQTDDEAARDRVRHSAHHLTFVYGYTENDLGQRHYGWLLQDHLG